MSAENKIWEQLKRDYLYKVERALSNVEHPRKKEVLEDVSAHLERRFGELNEGQKNRENFERIIGEMGPAEDYAELLEANSCPSNQKVQRKYLLYFGITGIVTIIAVVLAIVMFPTDYSLPKTEWKNLPLLDYETRTSLGSFEKFYEDNFHKANGYETASQKQKDAMLEQWIQEIHGLDYEKAVLAAAAIGDAKIHKAVPVLIEVATAKGGDNRIKWIAVRGLAKIADRRTVSVLITLIDHYNKNVRTYAKVALAEITDQFFGDSKEQWQKWREKNRTERQKNQQVTEEKGENYSERQAKEKDFSCSIDTDEKEAYGLGESICINIDLEHRLKYDLILKKGLKLSDMLSFQIKDARDNIVPIRSVLTANRDFLEERIEPNRVINELVDIADWYEISKAGEYTVTAKWRLETERQLFEGQSNTIYIAIIPKENKEIYELARQAAGISASKQRYNGSELKLVEIGDRAVPVLLDWLDAVKKKKIIIGEPCKPAENVAANILSQIGSVETYKIINDYNIPNYYRAIMLKRLDIWQSVDRYDKLTAALNDKGVDKKWVIFKLGVLGDKQTIPVLERIAKEDAELDIRETAKDALRHIAEPNIPMRYILHRASESIVLTASAESYRIGEPIKIEWKLVGGEYGSQKITEFSKPGWHFLPWGWDNQPFRITMRLDRSREMLPMGMPGSKIEISAPEGMTKFGELIPVKELSNMRKRMETSERNPLEGYIELSELGDMIDFKLQPGESRNYTLEDINSCFVITEPGTYEISARYENKRYIKSNRIKINIRGRPMEQGNKGK